jgi:hypothetical protein
VENGSGKFVSELLPATYREALLLEVAGLEPSQIAERLGLDPAGSATLLEIARAKLFSACLRVGARSTRENRVRPFEPAIHRRSILVVPGRYLRPAWWAC